MNWFYRWSNLGWWQRPSCDYGRVNTECPHWEETQTVPRAGMKINETEYVKVLCKLHECRGGYNSWVCPFGLKKRKKLWHVALKLILEDGDNGEDYNK